MRWGGSTGKRVSPGLTRGGERSTIIRVNRLPLQLARERADQSRRLREAVEAFLPIYVERLRALGATEVVLFGSMALGTARPESDIDVAVRGLDAEGLVRARGRLAFDAPATVEVVAFETAPTGLLATIARDGRVLYAA